MKQKPRDASEYRALVETELVRLEKVHPHDVLARYCALQPMVEQWWQALPDAQRKEPEERRAAELAESAKRSKAVAAAAPDPYTLALFKMTAKMTGKDGSEVLRLLLAQLAYEFHRAESSKQRRQAGEHNTGRRASRYAPREDAWIAAAKAAVASHAGALTAARRRKATGAIKAIEPKATRRKIADFVTRHWHEIDGFRTKPDRMNLSV